MERWIECGRRRLCLGSGCQWHGRVDAEGSKAPGLYERTFCSCVGVSSMTVEEEDSSLHNIECLSN